MNSLIERLGWTLLHSLWQGATAWVALEFSLLLLRRSSARLRYLAGCAALAFLVLAPWTTFFRLDLGARLERRTRPPAAAITEAASARRATQEEMVAPPPRANSANAAGALPLHSDSGRTTALRDTLRPWLSWLVWSWGAGCAWCWFRLAAGWKATRRLAAAELAPLPAAISEPFRALCTRMRMMRAIRIGQSVLVQVPTVVGWWRPVILWPAGMLAGLSSAQIEAILAHELAHIVRHDFVVNLLQAASEALFFYHPAVFAINRRIRQERGSVCDDIAVTMTGDSLGYAHALAQLESIRAPGFSLAATGDGELLHRIRRLLGAASSNAPGFRSLASLALASAGLYLAAMFALPALAAHVMTARERITAIEAAAPENSLVFRPGEMMSISCELHGQDGGLLDIDAYLFAISLSNRGSVACTIEVHQGRFAQEISAGRLSFNAWPSGFAPFFAGPFLPDAKTHILPRITLTLTRGFPARLRLTDPSGQPLSGVQLTGQICAAAGASAPSPSLSFTTDDDGQVSFENIDARTFIKLASTKSGFQDDEKTFTDVFPGEPLLWPLHPAVPKTVRVVDDVTGQPVAGVKIQLASRKHGEIFSMPDRDEHVLGATDADGRFTFDRLNSDWSYKVYLKSPEHALAVATVASAGNDQFRLQRGFRLAGIVRGLPAGPATVRCDYSMWLYSGIGAGGGQAITLPGDAPERSFAFEHLPPNFYELSVGQQRLHVSLQSDKPDLLFDLGAQTESATNRRVVIHFNPPTPEAPVAGALGVELNVANRADRPVVRYADARIPVSDGTATVDVIAPDKITLSPNHLLGYWFNPRTVDVPAGAEPLEITLDLLPAGAIRGRVLEPDGSVAHDGGPVSCVVDRGETARRIAATVSAEDGSFVATPLPFGSRYVVMARRGQNISVSSPTTVDARTPFPSVDIKRVRGVTIEGRVVDASNRPVAGATLNLSYDVSPRYSTSSPSVLTRVDGTFTLDDVNFDVPGQYHVAVYPPEPNQPATSILKLTRTTALPLVIKLERRR